MYSQKNKDDAVERVEQFLLGNLRRKLPEWSEISHVALMNRLAFNKIWIAKHGKPIPDFHREARIGAMHELIKAKFMMLKEYAYAFGYQQEQYASDHLKRMFGMTLAEARKFYHGK